MPTVPQPQTRQRPPAAEQKQMRDGQVAEFKRTLYAHELNIARLNALPAELRDANHADTLAAEQRAIAVLQSAIDTTEAQT